MSAIVLPWHDRQTVSAIQYRFTHVVLPKIARFGQKPRGSLQLYGLHRLHSHETLVLVEGEQNVISIWQDGENLDVLSWGPQANIVRPNAAKLATKIGTRYQRLRCQRPSHYGVFAAAPEFLLGSCLTLSWN